MDLKILMPRFRIVMPIFLIGIGLSVAIFKNALKFLPLGNLDMIGICVFLIGAILFLKRNSK